MALILLSVIGFDIYYAYQYPIFSANDEHIELINNKQVQARIIDKEITKKYLLTYSSRFTITYKLYIDDAYVIDCAKCGDLVTYTDDYLSVTEEMYNRYKIGDEMNICTDYTLAT